MWCWRRMENINWTDVIENEEMLHRTKEERNFVHTVKRRKANWIGHILLNKFRRYTSDEKTRKKMLAVTG
jgi:predicted protein tyrosine phosphatase